MAQTSIIPSVQSSARHWDGSMAIEARWSLHKTVFFAVWTSVALWTVIFLVARAVFLAGN
ncbi:MAG: hypothetical protein ACTSX7_09735 [Alphaproteobacteria bacterium]